MISKGPHDNFIKAILSNPEDAIAFFESTLPKDLLLNLNLSGLEQTKETFVKKNKNPTQADILWRIPAIDGDEIFVYLLFEHKSYYDPKTFFQILGYLIQIYEWQQNNGKQLVPVIPFVFYHGTKMWEMGKNFQDQFRERKKRDKIFRYIPNFQIELFELEKSRIDQDFDRRSLRIFLSVLQKIRCDKEEFLEVFFDALKLLGKEESQAKKVEILEKLLYYILSFRKADEDEIRELSNFKKIGMEGDVITLLEKLKEEGKLEGKIEGKIEGKLEGKIETAKRMLAKGVPISDVIEFTGLSEKVLSDNGLIE